MLNLGEMKASFIRSYIIYICWNYLAGNTLGPVSGSWSHYGVWDECSVTCGGGIRRRIRTCITVSCEGNRQETGECNVHSCDGTVSVKTQFTISFRT